MSHGHFWRGSAPSTSSRDGFLGRPGASEVIFLAAVMIVVIIVAVRACFTVESRIAFLFYDDAYYYFGVAKNLAEGAGSTFDGINPTNGYHPLWCWLLVPVFLVLEEPGLCLRAVGALWFSLAALAPIALWWALRPRTGPPGAVMAAALFALQPLIALRLARPNGLETPLYALLIALFIGCFERAVGARSRPPRYPVMVGLGLLLGGVLLARLDGCFLAVAAALLLTVHQPRWGWRAVSGRVGALALAAFLVAGPSLIWNVAAFGHPVPVSGRLISIHAERQRASLGGGASFGYLRERSFYAVQKLPRLVAGTAVKGTIASAPIRRTGKLGAGAVLAVSAAILVTAVLQRRRAGSLRSDALSLLTVFGLLHYSAYAFWLWIPGEDDYRLYYFMPQVMLASAALGGALGPPARRWIRSVWLRRALAAVGIVLLTQHLYDGILSRYEWRPWEAGPVAEKGLYGWVRRTFPEEAVLGARDAGKLGFFTERPVVNLDGLINDQRLLEAIRHDREDEYLLSSPVRYVLIGRPWLQGFDASNPQIPPRERGGLGETLYRLAQRPGVSLRDVTPGPGEGTEDWAVIEILRGGGDFSRNRAIRPAP